MNKENTKVLAEKREGVLAEMRLYADKVERENRNLTQEENDALSNLDKTQEDLAAKIETLSKIERVNSLSSEETRAVVISSPWHQGGKPYASGEERQRA